MAKRSGSLRLTKPPKPRLKRFPCRRLLDAILLKIPPHESAHGFRTGRSVATFVAPHVGQTVVLKMDLRDFFVSITNARIVAIYLTLGYPEAVARLLAGLSTNTVPLEVWNRSAGPASIQPARRPHPAKPAVSIGSPTCRRAPTSPASWPTVAAFIGSTPG